MEDLGAVSETKASLLLARFKVSRFHSVKLLMKTLNCNFSLTYNGYHSILSFFFFFFEIWCVLLPS